MSEFLPSTATTAAGISVPGTSAISDVGSPSAQLPTQSAAIHKKGSIKGLSKVEAKRLRKEQRAKQVISHKFHIVRNATITVGGIDEKETR